MSQSDRPSEDLSISQPFEHVSFDEPDEAPEGGNWRLELVNLAGGAQIGRITIQPGWRWSAHVKPITGTDICLAPTSSAMYRGGSRFAWLTAPRQSRLLVKSPVLRGTTHGGRR
jgi:hypothetical protein